MPRADATQEAVTASSIVEELDVVEDVGTRELASFVDTFSHALFFQTTKEGLHSVIPAVAAPAHAGL